jgi:glycosyltransferase involved in cell wall biosynthesis
MSRRITICICTYNRYDVLPLALESAVGQTMSRDQYRVIVVDNSPDHAAAEAFGAAWHDGDFLDYRIERTPGLSNARNVGARECGTEVIAYMDDDAIASPGWAAALLEGYDRFGAGVAAVGGRVDPIWGAPRPQWLADAMLGSVSVVNWGGSLRIADENEWLAGTNISFRTRAVLEAGGFDVKLGRNGGGASLMSNEEIMIAAYLRQQGMDTVYAPEARVRHLVEPRRLTQAWFRKRMVWQAVSDYTADTERTLTLVRKSWGATMEYFFALPPRERTIRGLYYETDSPDLFQRQLDALYVITALQLAGFEGVAEADRAALGA